VEKRRLTHGRPSNSTVATTILVVPFLVLFLNSQTAQYVTPGFIWWAVQGSNLRPADEVSAYRERN
jgi:hypothetical protein